MSESFGAAAVRLSAVSARALGWLPGEFWAATPAELVSALADPAAETGTAALSRDDLNRMMEHDGNG